MITVLDVNLDPLILVLHVQERESMNLIVSAQKECMMMELKFNVKNVHINVKPVQNVKINVTFVLVIELNYQLVLVQKELLKIKQMNVKFVQTNV